MPRLVAIDDPADPRIAAYRDVRERDLVGREGGFIAEGEVVLAALLHSRRPSPLRLTSVLLAEKRLEGLQGLLDLLPDEAPVHVAGQGVMDAIVGFHIHRGVLAMGEAGAPRSAEGLLAGLGPRALVVALFGVSNHDNIGGIFRNAAGFGADAVLLDPGCCDPLYRKAIRVSVGGTLTVPFARLPPGEEPVDLLRRHGLEPIALGPAAAEPLSRLPPIPRAALLLGAEGPGLSAGILARARAVAIPMAPGVDSLNVATTSGIALHQLASAR